ncbi:CoB--CoM heterodisulfide reductase iron-sulfur subunit A family protein, partial [Candidatus Sumerlaeota bacterium]|nr:CoB--CoM heterodisulfide reductase iron-sulfur subunit A family protein [Candidatus Sumerlaeota bacterium]
PVTPAEKGKLIVRCEDTLAGVVRRVPVDMVILCAALESRHDAKEVARIFSCSLSPDGFFLERHPKLAPVSTNTDGVFIAGCCQGPKDIPDSVAQGAAAASQVLSLISRGKVELDAAISEIDEERCSGCRICNDICPYSAIEFDEEKKVSRINPALCKGCGTCAAACPRGCITAKHFTDRQIISEIEGILA